MTGPATVRELGRAELDDWDAVAVHGSGGQVFQSRAWAEHRTETGWRPRYLAVGDTRALVLQRGWRLLPGGSAYVPRGPVGPGTPWVAGDPSGAAIGAALADIATWLERDGVDVLAADAEVRSDDAAYLGSLEARGFHAIPEIQPSRHRMALDLPPDGDAAPVLDGIAKATRQRIRRAERDGAVVLRWDAAPGDPDGFVRATEDAGDALERFHAMLRVTGDRRGLHVPGTGPVRDLVATRPGRRAPRVPRGP